MKRLDIKKILVPIDFSEASMNALYTATSMAKKYFAHIKLLFVHGNDDKYYPQINLNKGEEIIKTLTTLARLIKDDENVSCDFSYIMGDVSNCIIEMSNAENADLIIMGKNGASGNRKNLAGSNTYNVSRRSKSPVLIIPPGKIYSCFSHILFPVRPTLCMIEKYMMIKEIAKKDNAKLYILNLRNPDYIEELHIISRLVQLLKIKVEEENIQTSISYYFRDNKFADKILSVASDSKNEIDLLVINCETSNPANNFLISPYAQKIVHEANVPVLIIKPETNVQSRKPVLKELEKQLNYN
jgi:nucleotide-binding universal stress UspA family protein